MSGLLIGFLLAVLAQPFAHAASSSLRFMTFNVRTASATGDGPELWPKRRDLMVATIRQQRPDVMGTQELLQRQGDYLAEHLKHYAWFGIGRQGKESPQKPDNEHMGVFYRTDRLQKLESGNFWLSDTPHKPGSKPKGQPYSRMVTWAKFRIRKTGKTFYFYNTHFPYRKQAGALRTRAARILIKLLRKLPQSEPVVVTGDFNTQVGSRTHQIMTRHLRDAWLSTIHHSGPKLTFHGFTGTPTERIDWILYRGFDVDWARTVTTHRRHLYPSDHFPVVAQLQMQAGAR